MVLWLNGGPGCSSLLGLLEEIGPYLTEGEDGELVAHPYPWNKKANLLFLESPAGVGYSTNTVTDYEYTDDKTASDNYDAIKVGLLSIALGLVHSLHPIQRPQFLDLRRILRGDVHSLHRARDPERQQRPQESVDQSAGRADRQRAAGVN